MDTSHHIHESTQLPAQSSHPTWTTLCFELYVLDGCFKTTIFNERGYAYFHYILNIKAGHHLATGAISSQTTPTSHQLCLHWHHPAITISYPLFHLKLLHPPSTTLQQQCVHTPTYPLLALPINTLPRLNPLPPKITPHHRLRHHNQPSHPLLSQPQRIAPLHPQGIMASPTL